MKIIDEVVLPRRAVPQPSPALSAGGDCAACVLGGLLQKSVQEVYTELYKGNPEAPSRIETVQALQRALSFGLLTRLITTTPVWPTPEYYLAFGPSGYLHNIEWFSYTQMALEAGYYGISPVVFDRTGNGGLCPPPTDHVVLLCGVREISLPAHPKSSKIEHQVLLSCSASKAEEWVEVRELLTTRGAYNTIWAKPA